MRCDGKQAPEMIMGNLLKVIKLRKVSLLFGSTMKVCGIFIPILLLVNSITRGIGGEFFYPTLGLLNLCVVVLWAQSFNWDYREWRSKYIKQLGYTANQIRILALLLMAPTLLILGAMNTALCMHARMSIGGLCITVVGMVFGAVAVAYLLLTVKDFLAVRHESKHGVGASLLRVSLTRAIIKKDLSEEPVSIQFVQLVGYGILGIIFLILTAQSDSGLVWCVITALLAITLGIGYFCGLLQLESRETHYRVKRTYSLTACSLSRAKATVSAVFGFCLTLLMLCYGVILGQVQIVSLLIAILITIYIYLVTYTVGVIYLSRDRDRGNDSSIGVILMFFILGIILSPVLFVVGIVLCIQELARGVQKR